jgi:Myb-like DNA-binding domain
VDVVQAQISSSAQAILQNAPIAIEDMLSSDIHHIVETSFEPLDGSADAVLREFPPWEFADAVVQSTSSANERIRIGPQFDVDQDSPLIYEAAPVIGPPAATSDPDPVEGEDAVLPAGSSALPAPSEPTFAAPSPVETQQGIVLPRTSARRQTRQTGTSNRVSMPRNRPKSTRKPPDKWTSDQQHRFEHALEVHGRSWQAVSAHVEREVSSIKSHAQKHFIFLAKALKRVPDKVAETGVGHTLQGRRLVLNSSSSLGYLPNVNIEELQRKLDELYDEHETEIELKRESAANQVLQAPAAL